MKVKVPTKASLDGYLVHINYVSKLPDDIYGKCVNNCIEVALIKHKTKEELLSTVFHEMLHAILWKTGLQALLEGLSDTAEEAIVVALENHLNQAVKLDTKSWLEFTFVEIGES